MGAAPSCCEGTAEEQLPEDLLYSTTSDRHFSSSMRPSVQTEASKADEFVFVLERRKGANLGAQLDSSGGKNLHVATVGGGGDVAASNAKHKPSRQLRAGDYILSIDAVNRDPNAMLRRLLELSVLGEAEVSLHVVRPQEFSICIGDFEGSLGCGISYDASSGRSLVIDSINKGVVKDFNEALGVGKKGLREDDCMAAVNALRPSDRIVAVNCLRGTHRELLDAIRTARGNLELVISRPQGTPCGK